MRITRESRATKVAAQQLDRDMMSRSIEFGEDGQIGNGSQVGSAHNPAHVHRLVEDLRAAELANPVMDSLRNTGQLPSNYVTKSQAIAFGWKPGKALNNNVSGGQIGGDVFQDGASIGLPTAHGREWFEADIGLSNTMRRSNQPGTRLLYSNDGMAFVTPDHYGRLYELPDWK